MDRLTTTPRLRRAIIRRISRFGNGRMEVHSPVLEALVNDANDRDRLRQALHTARSYLWGETLGGVDAALAVINDAIGPVKI